MKRIIVAVNYVNYRNTLKAKIQRDALITLVNNKSSNVQLFSFNYRDENVVLPPEFHVCKSLKRNSKVTIRNPRPLPYIKEILDLCSNIPCDIFGYINSDIFVQKNLFSIFEKHNKDVYLFKRFDISDVDFLKFQSNNFRVKVKDHPGFDALFFNVNWWKKCSKRFNNDLILGEPEWDFYYHRKIMSLTRNIFEGRFLYHILHPTIWTLNSPGAINNRRINGTLG